MPFVKGQSGNPGGRPKVVGEVQELARSHTADAVTTLAEIMRDTAAAPAARVAAANALLDRGYWKPLQSSTVSVRRVNAREMSDDELAAIALGRSEGAADPADDPPIAH
jgi:hypothetical protein